MNRTDNPQQQKWDWLLLGTVGVLLAIGLSVVYSATQGEPGHHWQKQILFAGMGLVA